MSHPLLSLQLWVDYPGKPNVIDGAAFEIEPGEIFGLAGASGSGKSTIGLAILRLLHLRGGRARGEIRFDGRDLLAMRERQLRRLRGSDISLVLQSPAAALNPVLRLGAQLREAWQVHSPVPWRAARPQGENTLRNMGLPADEEFLRRYPGQISVGQAQRVVIAMAMLHRPKLVIADEPTSALDPDARGGILDLLAARNAEDGAAILYISHDLDSMRRLCHRTAVLHAGRIVDPARYNSSEWQLLAR